MLSSFRYCSAPRSKLFCRFSLFFRLCSLCLRIMSRWARDSPIAKAGNLLPASSSCSYISSISISARSLSRDISRFSLFIFKSSSLNSIFLPWVSLTLWTNISTLSLDRASSFSKAIFSFFKSSNDFCNYFIFYITSASVWERIEFLSKSKETSFLATGLGGSLGAGAGYLISGGGS